MPDVDNKFGGSLGLDFRKWWRHVQRISPPVTLRAWKKDLSKAKPLGFLEPTLQKQHLKKAWKISDHTCVSEAIQIIW